MPGFPERIETHEHAFTRQAGESDLAVVATLEAYIEQIRRETDDPAALARRLHAIEGRIQAVIDLATKGDSRGDPV